jgi:hypothetical protein
MFSQYLTSKSPLLAFISLVDSLLGSLAVFQSEKAAPKYGGGWTAATAATTTTQNRFE